MRKRFLALFIGSALVPAAAQAADLGPAVTKAQMLAPTPAINWAGFYVGGNIGYGWGHVATSNNTGTSPDGVLFAGVPFAGAAGTHPGPDRSYDLNSGFNGGVQFGYDYEFANRVVLGVEGDFDWANFKGDDDFLTSPDPGPGGVRGGPEYQVSTKADWYATIRGRLGYAFDAFMPYVTGGVAFVHTTADVTVTPGRVADPLGRSHSASGSQTATGYAVGAGLEYAFARNWSIKAEYLHLGFSDKGTDIGFGALGSVHSDARLDFDIARLGVNYRV